MSDQPVGIGSYVLYVQFVKGQPEAAVKAATADMNKAKKPIEDSGRKLGGSWKAAFAASIAIGAVLLNEVNKVQAGVNQIRTATGATGQAFEDLKKSATNVWGTVPNSFNEIGGVLGSLNTRLGLTGKALEDATKSVIDLADLTGTSATANVDALATVINDWGLSAENSTAILDQLFRATQISGISIEKLTATLTKSGATLRSYGFSFEEAIALLAAFEKSGVNTEQVLSGMRRGLANAAKAGEPLNQVFARSVEEIQNAATDTEALNIAIERFGARSAGEFASAIREGKFEIAGYAQQIKFGTDTIEAADKATQTFGEGLNELKQSVLKDFAPVLLNLSEALTVVSGLFTKVPPKLLIVGVAVTTLAVKFNSLSASINRTSASLKTFFAAKFTGPITAILVGVTAGLVIGNKLVERSEEAFKIAEKLAPKIEQNNQKLLESLNVSNERGEIIGLAKDQVELSTQALYNYEMHKEFIKSAKEDVGEFEGMLRGIRSQSLAWNYPKEVAEAVAANNNLIASEENLINLRGQNKELADELFKKQVEGALAVGVSQETINEAYARFIQLQKQTITQASEITDLPRNYNVKEIDALAQAEKEFGRALDANVTLMDKWSSTTNAAFNPVRRLMDAQQKLVDTKFELLDIEKQIKELEAEQFETEAIDFLQKGESLFEAENRRNAEKLTQDKERAQFEKELVDRREQLDKEVAEINKGNIDRAFSVIEAQKQVASALAPLVEQGKSGIEALDIVIGELRAAGVSEQDLQAFRDQAIPLIQEGEETANRFAAFIEQENAAIRSRTDAIMAEGDRLQTAFESTVTETFGTLDTTTKSQWASLLAESGNYTAEEIKILMNRYEMLRKMVLEMEAQSALSEGGATVTPLEEMVIKGFGAGQFTFDQAMEQLALMRSKPVMAQGVLPSLDQQTTAGSALENIGNFLSGAKRLMKENPIAALGFLSAPLTGLYSLLYREVWRDTIGKNKLYMDGYDRPPKRAMGGPVNPSKFYMVGERGPELFVPSQSGYIMSNRDLMSGMAGGGITNVFQTRELSAAQLADEVSFRQARQLKGRQR